MRPPGPGSWPSSKPPSRRDPGDPWHRGFARFVRVDKGAVTLDRAAIERDAPAGRQFVLRTSTAWTRPTSPERTRALWRGSSARSRAKSTLEVRPVFHHRDDPRWATSWAAFLALRPEVDLQRRLDERGVEWPGRI